MAEETDYKPRLYTEYKDNVKDALMDKFEYDNVMDVPEIRKIVISMGIGNANEDPEELRKAKQEIKDITGQKPIVTKAKQDISDFEIRKGDPVGCYVTLRRDRMYEFLDRLISIALPRVKDFSGLKDTSFDGSGNYNFGINEQIIFPEIGYEQVEKVRGMNITITTSANTDEEGYELLDKLGFPFKNN